jgi:molybdopterin-guanine dinucleotide biosynthesis protein A
MLSAAILAGGRARRFGGRDKSALLVGGVRILDRQLAVLRDVAGHLMIVANDPDRYADAGVQVVADLVPGAGPLGGIYTALAVAPTAQTIVVACDLPFLTSAWLEHLAAAGRDIDAAVPRSRAGVEPLCAAYSRGCLEPIRRRLEARDLAVRGFLADVRVREIGPEEIDAFDPDGTLLSNLNTPLDYRRALAHHERRRG